MQLDKWPTSLPSYLTRWQIGLPLYRHELDESPRFCTNVLRHIFKGRSSSSSTNKPLHATEFDPYQGLRSDKRAKISAPRQQWSRIQFSPENEFLNQYILIKGGALTHFYTPNHTSPSCHLKFSMGNWTNYDVWHVKPAVPIMTDSSHSSNPRHLLKVPNTLVVLREEWLVLYCFETGKRLQRYELDSEFDDVTVHDEENLIHVSKDGEYLVFSYPPLKFLHRVIIPCGGSDVGGNNGDLNANWTGLSGFERLGGLALISRKNQGVEFYDYEELMDINKEPDGSSKIIILRDKPEPLISLKTRDNYLVLLPSWPPKVIVQRKKGVEEIYSLDKKESIFRVAAELPDYGELGVGLIRCFDEQRQRIFVHGLPHGFDVFDFCEKEGIYRVIFTTKNISQKYGLYIKDEDKTDDTTPDQIITSGRQGLRARKRRISYDEFESLPAKEKWGFGYDDSLDLVACCLFSDGILYPIILDNNTPDLALFLRLNPVRISVPEISDKNLACDSLSIHFYEWFMAVRLKLHDANSYYVCEQLYLFTVFAEDLAK